MLASVIHELHFVCSLITIIFDLTVRLDGASLANTFIPLHPLNGTRALHGAEERMDFDWWVSCAGAIQVKEGGIQVLADLAPSSQTVGSDIGAIYEQAKRSS